MILTIVTKKDAKLPDKWIAEKKTVKAIQVAFDLGEEIQYIIRREALDSNITASDRVREILKLPIHRRPQRLRLSISLSEDDFQELGEKFGLNPQNRNEIKKRAAGLLIDHVKDNGN